MRIRVFWKWSFRIKDVMFKKFLYLPFFKVTKLQSSTFILTLLNLNYKAEMYLASSFSFSKTCENETSPPYKVFGFICVRVWIMTLIESVAEKYSRIKTAAKCTL